MSSTVRFTPVHPADHDDMIYTSRNSHGAGVRITDLEGLKNELSDTLVSQMDTRSYTERDEYPAREWELLLGFTTWGGESDNEADYHNLSNTGAEDMAELWATVSQYTDAFFLFQTGFQGAWPHVVELVTGPGDFYRVDACNGEVELQKIMADVVDRESVDITSNSP